MNYKGTYLYSVKETGKTVKSINPKRVTPIMFTITITVKTHIEDHTFTLEILHMEPHFNDLISHTYINQNNLVRFNKRFHRCFKSEGSLYMPLTVTRRRNGFIL